MYDKNIIAIGKALDGYAIVTGMNLVHKIYKPRISSMASLTETDQKQIQIRRIGNACKMLSSRLEFRVHLHVQGVVFTLFLHFLALE